MKKFLLVFPLVILLSSFFIAAYALAQTTCYCYCTDGVTTNYLGTRADRTACEGDCQPRSGICGVNPSTSTGGQISLRDPLNLSGPEELYARIITSLLGFVGIASLITFVYAGFMFLISAGNPEKVKKAKDTMFYSVIGVVLAIASYAILSFIFKTLETATGQ